MMKERIDDLPQEPSSQGDARPARPAELDRERTALANERTLLAYIRTMLAFFIVGGTLIKFFGSPFFALMGWIFIAVGFAPLTIGVIRYKRVRRMIERSGAFSGNDFEG